MKTDIKEKAIYITPEIRVVRLDNEISLVLQSTITPPVGPDESQLIHDFMEKDPFHFTA